MKYASFGVIIALIATPLVLAFSMSGMKMTHNASESFCPVSFLMNLVDMDCSDGTDAVALVGSHVDIMQHVSVGILSLDFFLLLTIVCLAIVILYLPSYRARSDLMARPVESRSRCWKEFRSLALAKHRRWLTLRSVPYLRSPTGYGVFA